MLCSQSQMRARPPLREGGQGATAGPSRAVASPCGEGTSAPEARERPPARRPALRWIQGWVLCRQGVPPEAERNFSGPRVCNLVCKEPDGKYGKSFEGHMVPALTMQFASRFRKRP